MKSNKVWNTAPWVIFALMVSLHSSVAYALPAKSCNQPDVLTALTNAVAGETVTIPAGTCTWNAPISWTAPPDVVIKGAGSQTVVGGGDATVIIDNVSHSPTDTATLSITTTTGSFRLSGITFQGTNGNPSYHGIVRIGGKSKTFRMDHVHFKNVPGIISSVRDWVYGVVDHCLWDMANDSVDNALRVNHSKWNEFSYGDGSWADDSTFGSERFVFMEDNIFNNGFATDVNMGGRIVFRYNTLNFTEFQVHEMEDRNRAARAWEVYGNSFSCNPALRNNCGEAAVFVRGGTGLVWGNTALNTKYFIKANNDRTNTGHSFGVPPNNWGYCGTTYGPSTWDQNSDSTGYACIDQIGRGRGDLLPQSYWPLAGSWPHQALEPIYEWANTVTVASGWTGSRFAYDNISMKPNRDFYLESSTFNGSSGVGKGELSARPIRCTPLSGYWATDTKTLYQCSMADKWTVYYKPYTYPHPLVSGILAAMPKTPTNLRTR